MTPAQREALLAKVKVFEDAERREKRERNQMFSIPWEDGRCVFGGGRPGSYPPPDKDRGDDQ